MNTSKYRFIINVSILILIGLFLVPNISLGQQKKLKVAALLPGSISDASFNAAAYRALERMKKEYGIEYVYQENVPQAEIEAAFSGICESWTRTS